MLDKNALSQLKTLKKEIHDTMKLKVRSKRL